MADGEDAAGALDSFAHVEGVLQRVGDRLVRVDGFAGFKRRDDEIAMGVVGRSDHHALDLVVGEQLVERRRRLGHAELLLEGGALLRGTAETRGQLDHVTADERARAEGDPEVREGRVGKGESDSVSGTPLD